MKKLLLWCCLATIAQAAFIAGATAKQPGKSPVKVFVLAGQSNMEGAGAVASNPNRNGGQGSLEYLVKRSPNKERFAHTIDKNGAWRVRDDVWIWYLGRKGGLSVGYGARNSAIGPEFQFGHVVGERFDNQVLLIKTAWGGKSLVTDFRPPSSGGAVGPFYKEMISHVKTVLNDLKNEFPDYDGAGYEISGFGWHQGWNDGLKAPWVAEYEENLTNLIKDLRKEFGVADLPVVIANSGFGGRKQKIDRRLGIINAQLGVAKRPEFKGTVYTVETRDFFRPPEVSPSRQGYHWNSNAETYFLIGDAMGKAMIKLIGD
jgi:alpha-galactosidase